MKKQKQNKRISKVLARFTYHTAKGGAGLASRFGVHQPKVPDKLAK
jgi:cyclic lactone autoinducer peptide